RGCLGNQEKEPLRNPVLDNAVFSASLVRDLHGRGTRRGGYLADEWTHFSMTRRYLVTQS
ncbi:MAG: hypothetical protein ACTIBG_18200, partial [Brevibacterium aurantiacum]|uniref:hypothetical protein n=1 Tax=Brevibacterium aurantiacum TaxID=273384 RepID=UPI003F8D9152